MEHRHHRNCCDSGRVQTRCPHQSSSTLNPQLQWPNHDSETKIMSTLPKRRKPSFQLGLFGAIALFLVLGPGLNGISGSSFTQTEARPITDQAPIWRQNVLTLPLQLNPNDNDNYNRQLVQSGDEQDIDTTYLLQQHQQHLEEHQQREGGSDETLQLY